MTTFDYIRDPAEITRRSFEIIASEIDLATLPEEIAPIAARIAHASGMPDIVADIVYSEGVVTIARDALAAGAPILCDVGMVAAGISTRAHSASHPVHTASTQIGATELASRSGQTRSAAGMELLARHHSGAVVVIGNAPTALFRLLELVAEGEAQPAAVLGFPVGFVGAAESKRALAESKLGLPFITLFGRRGGSAIAAAALNAIILGHTS
jgi:precorrin-8X/cobalt-precorrin-8 methylmutase